MKRHSGNQRSIELASISPTSTNQSTTVRRSSTSSPNTKFPTSTKINPLGDRVVQEEEDGEEANPNSHSQLLASNQWPTDVVNESNTYSHSYIDHPREASLKTGGEAKIGTMNGSSQRATSSSSSLSSSSSPEAQAASNIAALSTSTSTSTNRRRSEVDPLLVPPYDPNYSTNSNIMDSNHQPSSSSTSNNNHTNHLENHQSASASTSASKRPVHSHSASSSSSSHNAHHHRNDDETIIEFDDEEDELLTGSSDQNLLIVDKPSAIRTQQSSKNVFLLNFLALAFVSFNMTLNLTVLAIIHERVPMTEPHLPDIAFDILPDIRSLLDVSEYYIVFQMVSVFVLLFFHRHRSIILRRVCIIMGVIYFFRGICMASTQLPLASRNYTCSPQLKNSSEYANMTSLEFIGIISQRVFAMSLGMGLSINGHHNYCGDYIFSGHTVILLLTYLTFQEYLLPARRKNLFWRLYQLFLIAMTIVSIVCIIIARGHYFIDVILAYFVTTRIFWMYHAMCNSSLTSMRSFTSYFSRLWWWPVFLYFENIKPVTNGHSIKSDEPPNPVQRVFEWPLPYPKQLARRKHRNQFMA